MTIYDEVIQVIPKFHGTYSNKAMVLDKMGRFEDSVAMFDVSIELDPEYAGTYYNKGIKNNKNI